MTSSFWLNVGLVALVNLCGAWCWAIYIRSASANNPVRAACADCGLIALQMVTVVSYVHDQRLAVPALLAAFVGTFTAVKWGKR